MILGLMDLLKQVCYLLAWVQEGAASVPEQTATPAVSTKEVAEQGQEIGLLSVLLSPVNLILFSGLLFVFLVLRPQQKQMQEMQGKLAGLKKNDRVVTASGIHGTVVQTGSEDSVVVLRIDENSGARMTINRESIARIVNEGSE